MEMLRFYKPKAPLPVAVISTEPAFRREDGFLIRLGRGLRAGQLSQGNTYGPYLETELAQRVAQLELQLRAEGYLPSGEHGLAEAFASGSAKQRARAAHRVGWRRERRIVPLLLSALPNAVDEVCPIIDALGRIGDPGCIAVVRPYAERKLLSRRRSGVEALRNLGDTEGVAQAQQRVLDELPDNVRNVVAPMLAKPDSQGVQALVAALKVVDSKRKALTCDLLYELGLPVATEAVRATLAEFAFNRPFVWRYIKSLYKRAELRNDFAFWGELCHRIERQAGPSTSSKATVKSGYDGVSREVPIFSRRTQSYMRRAAWRYLRHLARYRPALYPMAAAEALIQYGDLDATQPTGKLGAFAGCYLLNRLLWGNSKRFKLRKRSLRFQLLNSKQAKAPEGVREEAYPELWDAEPRAYLRLLAAAKLAEVQEFAYRAICQRHAGLLGRIELAELTALLDSPYEPMVKTVLAELEKRFDPHRMDWDLPVRLARHQLEAAKALGLKILRLTAGQWLSDPARALTFLSVNDPQMASSVAAIAREALPALPDARRQLATAFFAALRASKKVAVTEQLPKEGVTDADVLGSSDGLEAVAHVCRESLRDELLPLADTADLFQLVQSGSNSAKAVAVELLAAKPDAIERIGLHGLIALARHPVVAVRAAAATMMESAGAQWRQDPSALFALLDCEWADSRTVSEKILRRDIDFVNAPEALDLTQGLLDSNYVDVQDFAKQLVLQNKDRFNLAALIFRLAEHPHVNMRGLAMELAVEHLPEGADALHRVEGVCRSALLDVWPQLKLKRRVIAFLRKRGVCDPEQAKACLLLLEELVATQGRADREDILDALVRIKLAQPEAQSEMSLLNG
ncbi:MAG TPA: hypothetical protein VGP72_31790 [Planctomycetota bacterium]|jgi:hypothetical protein